MSLQLMYSIGGVYPCDKEHNGGHFRILKALCLEGVVVESQILHKIPIQTPPQRLRRPTSTTSGGYTGPLNSAKTLELSSIV